MMQNYFEKKLANQIASKELDLTRIAESAVPINPKLEMAHCRRVENAKDYLDELPEIKSLLGCGLTFKIVTISKFAKTLEAADISRVEFDGKFCKIAIITTYPAGDRYLVAMAALNAL